MGFVIDFDAGNRLLRVTVKGNLDDEILLHAYESIERYVASHPPCRGLVDLSAVTKFEVSSKGVRALARRPPAIPHGEMRIVVAPLDSVYGMARMFQILGELTRPDLHVVRTVEEAFRLLQVESPEFRIID
ncbi:MAG TPA: hypothetical protein VGM18_16060 [Candidatus Sulfotelmatobacter sp.]